MPHAEAIRLAQFIIRKVRFHVREQNSLKWIRTGLNPFHRELGDSTPALEKVRDEVGAEERCLLRFRKGAEIPLISFRQRQVRPFHESLNPVNPKSSILAMWQCTGCRTNPIRQKSWQSLKRIGGKRTAIPFIPCEELITSDPGQRHSDPLTGGLADQIIGYHRRVGKRLIERLDHGG